MTVCREFDQGIEWHKVREATDRGLADWADQLELGIETANPNPDTWGLTPAQIKAQERAMRAGGAVDGS